MALRELAVNYSVNTGRARREIDTLNRKADRSKDTLGKMGTKLSSVGRIARRAAIGIGAVAMAASAAFVGKGISNAMSFKYQLAKIKGTASLVSEELSRVEEKAVEMGIKTMETSSAALKGLDELMRAGMGLNAALKAIYPSLDFAVSTGQELGFTTNALTDILNMFDMTANQSRTALDQWAAAGASASTNVMELYQGLQYAGLSANALGYSLSDTLAMLAMLSDAGLKGTKAGTNLTASFRQLTKVMSGTETARMQKAIHDLGPEVGQVVKEVRSGNATFDDLMEVLTKVEAPLEALQPLFGDEGVKAVMAFQKGLKKTEGTFEEFARTFARVEGETRRRAGYMEDTSKGALERMKASFLETSKAVGEKFLGSVKDSMDEGITPLLNSLTDAIKKSDSFSAALNKIWEAVEEEEVFEKAAQFGFKIVEYIGKGMWAGLKGMNVITRSLLMGSIGFLVGGPVGAGKGITLSLGIEAAKIPDTIRKLFDATEYFQKPLTFEMKGIKAMEPETKPEKGTPFGIPTAHELFGGPLGEFGKWTLQKYKSKPTPWSVAGKEISDFFTRDIPGFFGGLFGGVEAQAATLNQTQVQNEVSKVYRGSQFNRYDFGDFKADIVIQEAPPQISEKDVRQIWQDLTPKIKSLFLGELERQLILPSQ